MEGSHNLALFTPDLAYTIFSGEYRYTNDIFNHLKNSTDFQPWQMHVFPGNQNNASYNQETKDQSDEVIRHFKDYYYESFVSSLFPGKSDNEFSAYTKSYTKILEESRLISGIETNFKYLDLFLFPGNIAVFSFKCEFPQASLEDVTYINNEIRNFKAKQITHLLERMSDFGYDAELILANKLKTFTVIECNHDFDKSYSEEHLLYDISTCSPVGSSVGEGKLPGLKPSREYFNRLIKNNKISVFDNWSALALFDTFTLLHKDKVDNFQWESNYFRLLYIHSLYVQCFLVDMNRRFLYENRKRNLEDEFHQFDKYFNLRKISYNFLPQLIYEKVRYGLDLEDELGLIKESIERDDRKQKEKRDREESANEKRINNALVLVAFLAVFSAVFDGAEWIYNVVTDKRQIAYDLTSSLFFIAILIGILIYFLTTRGKKPNP